MEMAIALPLILLIMAGVVDMGLLLWEQEVLTNACREGARAGARAGANGKPEIKTGVATTSTKIRTLVQDYLRKMNVKDPSGSLITLTTSNCICSWDTTSDPNLFTISVELRNIPRKMMLLPNFMGLFDGTMDEFLYLNSKTTMAAEWVTPPSS